MKRFFRKVKVALLRPFVQRTYDTYVFQSVFVFLCCIDLHKG